MGDPVIFLSHSGTDSARAQLVGRLLEDSGVRVMLDLTHLEAAGSFVEFMETGLQQADYFLLLWSRSAEQRHWVRAEWQAAFAREANVNRVFVLVGRLEEHPVPVLLQPRRWIDLFPRVEDGLLELASMWKDDRSVASQYRKDVLPPLSADPPSANAAPARDEVYVTSELFDCTIPVPADLEAPAGLLLDYVINRLQLPRQISVLGAVGLDLSYRLTSGGAPLDRALSAGAQGLRSRSALSLEVTTREFARTAPQEEGRQRVYRAIDPRHQQLLARLASVGLRRVRS
jgi:hypothetical protein